MREEKITSPNLDYYFLSFLLNSMNLLFLYINTYFAVIAPLKRE